MSPPADEPSPTHAVPEAPLSVVVVCHQSEGCLAACLRSIARQVPRPTETIVVDSGSTDRTAAISRGFVDARWHPLGHNLGFAAAANAGVRASTAPLVAVLNADIELHPGWIAAMLEAANRHPRAASFASVQFLAGEPGTLDGAGDILHCSGLAWRRGHGARSAPPRDLEAFSACAAAAVYRRDRFLEAGGFEETFFCYFEDVDLGFRLRLAGHGCVSVAKARCEHAHGHASGGGRSRFATYHGHRNMVWSFVRCMPAPLAMLLLPAFAAAQLASVAAGAMRGQGRVVLQAKRDAIRGLAPALAARRSIQRRRTASAAAIASAMHWSLLPRRRSLRGRDAAIAVAPADPAR